MLRIGLIGAARIAPLAIIAPAKARDDTEIVAVAARDQARAEEYAQQHGIPVALGSYSDLIARSDIDLLYCPLPPSAHLDICLEAIAAGKALLVEKPWSRNADEARRIADAAAKAGTPVIEAFHYRYHGLFERALDLVRSGALGAIAAAEGQFVANIAERPGELRWTPSLGGGASMDLGCYVFHGLRTLLGEEPEVASAEAEVRCGVDAAMTAELVFPGGVRAPTKSSMLEPRCDRLRLEGERGTLTYDTFVTPQSAGVLSVVIDGQEARYEAEGPGSYDCQLAHVVDVIVNGATPLTGGDDAVNNMAVLDAVRRAAGLDHLVA